MSKGQNLGFGGVLIGFGLGWLVFSYFEISSDLISWLVIIAGLGIVAGSLLSRNRFQFNYGGLISGLVGGLILSLIFTNGFGFIGNIFGRSITGSGNLVSEDMSFSGFTVVDAGYGFTVEITKSASYSIKIITDDNVMEYVQVSKSGNDLNINLKTGSYQNVVLKAEITMPDLNELELSGGSHGYVDGFTSLDEFTLDLSGGSHADVEGSAEVLIVDASGGSHIELADFSVGNANIELSGGSHGTINVEGQLDADVSGGSILTYIGDPVLGDISTSGGSTVSEK